MGRRPLPEPAFARRLRRLDAAALRTFVADVYEARGYAVERADDALRVTPPRGEPRRLVVSPPPRLRRLRRLRRQRVDPTADVVVAVDASGIDAPDGARLVDGAALYDLLLHGIDRARARELTERHLDVALERAADDADADGPQSATTLLRPELLVVPAVVVLVAAAVLAGVGPWAGPSSSQFGATDGPPADETSTAGTPTPTPIPEREAETLPVAGVGPDGVTNATALAREHARVVDATSYQLELVSVEYVDGTETGRMTERVRVASPTVYRADITYSGDALGLPSPAQNRTVYADGERRYVWSTTRDTLVETRAVDEGGEYTRRAASLVGGFLSVRNSTVTRVARPAWSEEAYLLELNGTANPFVTEYRGGAVVVPPGVVVSMSVRYRASESPNRTVAVSVAYDGFGRISVDQPEWDTDSDAVTASNATSSASSTQTAAQRTRRRTSARLSGPQPTGRR